MGSSGAAGQNQRQLIDETEELARKLERLARERSRPDLTQTARRLQQAADEMRRASANRSVGDIGRGTEAVEQLREARRLLERNRDFQMSTEMKDLTERAERAKRMQERITEEVGELGAQGAQGEEGRSGARGGESEEKISKILGEKDQLEREVGALESQIDRVARQARGTEKDAARSLSEAAESIRENQVKEKIRYSKGVVRGRSPDYAQRFEQEIGSDLGEMAERLGEAQRALGGSKEDKSAQALEEARDLVKRMESFHEGVEDRGSQRKAERLGRTGEEGSQGEQAERGEKGEKGAESGEGEQGEGRQGERQASRGESGEPGQQGEAGERGEQSGREPGSQGEPGEQGEGGRKSGEGRRLADRSQQGDPSGEPGSRDGQQSQGGEGEDRGAMSATAPSIGQGVPGWYQPGIFTPEDLRQMSAEFEQRLREGKELRDNLRQLGMSADDLDKVLRQMQDWKVRGINNDPLALEALRGKVIEGLRQFEYRLWRDLEGEGGERLYLAGADEVPPGYREMVEEYYMNLASKK
jgi:hypothetical protein